MILPVADPAALAPLLDGWEEGMLYAYLFGRMGYAATNEDFRSAQVRVGDFCFFAGAPDAVVAAWQPEKTQPYTVFIPRTRDW
ncbi:MAG: GNAT family N-acetyltransferase, partial [Agathobaculum sp.]